VNSDATRVDAITQSRTDWLDVDPDAFRAAAARGVPLPFRHRAGTFLDFEPLALEPTARQLPAAWLTVNDGRLPELSPPATKLAFDDGPTALHDLYRRCLSVRLYHVNHLPGLGALVREILDEAEHLLDGYGGGMRRRDASLFCGSPGSNVPIHCDRHDNLLLQLAGTKQVTIGTFRDPARQLAEIERNFGDHLNLTVVPDELHVIELGPGDGIFLPPYTIHGVRCGDEPSTALSASFSTAASERAELVHLVNRRLRRLHVQPRGPGTSERTDRAKATGITWARRLKSQLVKSRRR
jgi:cupin superfamily protein